jgi:hypothetical protein
LEFIEDDDGLILNYRSDQPGNAWVWHELSGHGRVTLSKVFSFERRDLLVEPDPDLDQDDFEAFDYEFRFATRENGYFRIEGRLLDVDNPVLIAAEGLVIQRKLFAAERGIGIFPKIADLMAPDQPIAIGGSSTGAIPIPEFQRLLRMFPNTGELIPAKELAGSVMQAEKYLFHLTKWGLAGEKALTRRYAAELPPGVEIRITNPKAMIILGRDRRANGDDALTGPQRLDLEIIKRKFANMIDVLTYDDLLRRLDAIIVSLQRRAMAGAPTAAAPHSTPSD